MRYTYTLVLALLAIPALADEPVTVCLTQAEIQAKVDSAAQMAVAQFMAQTAQARSKAVDEKLQAAFSPQSAKTRPIGPPGHTIVVPNHKEPPNDQETPSQTDGQVPGQNGAGNEARTQGQAPDETAHDQAR